MSWIEKINTQLIITTGDGKVYTPNWMNAEKSVEYNIAEFDFPNLSGTLVKRSQPRGARYSLEIIFQGEDNYDQASDFEISAADKRAWNINHPVFGKIIVQPNGLRFDFTSINVARITGTIIETIEEENPKVNVAPQDYILQSKEITDEAFAVSFANEVTPNTSDINTLTRNTSSMYLAASTKVTDADESTQYNNLYNEANSAILDATSEPLIAIQKTQRFINYPPTLLSSSVKSRITVLQTQLNNLIASIDTVITKAEKKIFESNAGALVSSMAIAAAYPAPGNYTNKNDVIEVMELVLSNYSAYQLNLDGLQTVDGGNTTSFIPDAGSLINLNNLINFTVSNLFNIALDAKQERIIILEHDSNVVQLAHRFYGLNADDTTIDELIAANGWGLNQIIQVPKGTSISYYI